MYVLAFEIREGLSLLCLGRGSVIPEFIEMAARLLRQAEMGIWELLSSPLKPTLRENLLEGPGPFSLSFSKWGYIVIK